MTWPKEEWWRSFGNAIEEGSHIRRHGRTFDMPARPSDTPWRRPNWVRNVILYTIQVECVEISMRLYDTTIPTSSSPHLRGAFPQCKVFWMLLAVKVYILNCWNSVTKTAAVVFSHNSNEKIRHEHSMHTLTFCCTSLSFRRKFAISVAKLLCIKIHWTVRCHIRIAVKHIAM